MTSASLRPLLVATVLQSIAAAVLVARGTVTLGRGPLVDAAGILAGVLVGVGLYRLIASGTGNARHARPAAVIALALVFVAISVAEEILWRGLAFDYLAPRGTVLALIVTTVGFALVHGVHQGFSGVRFHLLTGLAFGLTMLVTGSLLAAIAAHTGYNLTLFLTTVTARKRGLHDPVAVG